MKIFNQKSSRRSPKQNRIFNPLDPLADPHDKLLFEEPTGLESLKILRARILTRMIVGALLFGVLAYVMSVPERIRQGQWLLVIIFTVSLAWMSLVAVAGWVADRQKKDSIWNSYGLRSMSFLVLVAALGIATLSSEGLYGSGRIYLIMLPVLAGILVSPRAGTVSMVLMLIILIGYASFVLTGRIPAPVLEEGAGNDSLVSWLIAITTFLLMGGVTIISLVYTFGGLETSLEKEQELTQELDVERSRLESRVAERTQDLERRLTQIRAAAEISRTVTQMGARLDMRQLLSEIVEIIREGFQLYYVGVFLLDEAQTYAVLQAGTGEAGQRMLTSGHRLAVSESSMIGWSIVNQQPRIALDVGAEAVRFDNPHLPQTRSEMALPLLVGAGSASLTRSAEDSEKRRCLGAMTIQSVRPLAFDQDDITVLQGIADSLATALDNALLFQQVRQNLDEIRALNRQYTTEAWSKAIQAQEAAASLRYTVVNPKAPGIATASTTPEAMPEGEYDANTSFAPGDSSLVTKAFSMTLRDQVIGQLILELDQEDLSPEDQTFVEAVVTEASLALENVRLLEDTQRRAGYERLLTEVAREARSSTELESILRLTIQSLGKALGATEGIIRLDASQTKTVLHPPGG